MVKLTVLALRTAQLLKHFVLKVVAIAPVPAPSCQGVHD